MWKRISIEAGIVLVQTALLLGLTATVGVERGEQPEAANGISNAVVSRRAERASAGTTKIVGKCPFLPVAPGEHCGHAKK